MDVEAAEKISNRGAKLKQEGEIEAAIACYRQAIELSPNNYQYYYQLANILKEQGQLKQAEIYLQQAIKLDSANSWCYHSLGEVLVQQNKLVKAVDCYRKSIDLNPDFSWSHYNLGRILHQQNRISEAAECYRLAIKCDSQYSWSHHFLAEILAKQEQIELAIDHYCQAIKFNPDFYISHYELGRNLQRKFLYQEAIDCYLKVIELKPQYFWSYYYLAKVFVATGEFDRAIQYYQQAIELNPKYLQVYFSLGQILLARGQQAIQDYRNSLKNKSKLWQVYFEIGLGQAWEKQSNFESAINCYLNAVKIDPYQELPYKILQYIEIPPQKLNEIIVFYQEITDKIPNLDLAWGNLGDVLTQADKLDEAIICYRHSCYYNAVNNNSDLAKLNWARKKQKAPNFIIIGAAKCGTSSLFAYIQKHPQVLLPYKKEINFFNKHFDKGIDWYLSHFPVITDSENFITGEATTQYIFTPEVERRIYNSFADVKIIIMLRDPIDRTISDYYHHVNRGLETRSIETIIKTTQELLKQFSQPEVEYTISEFDYIFKSIYLFQIYRWIEIFPSSNILILNSDRFFENTASVMNDVWHFLQLDCYSSSTYIKYNVGNYIPVADEIKQELGRLFEPYNRKLEEYLNLKFNW